MPTERFPPEWRERIRLLRDPTGSHAKIALADSGPDGSFEAVVGSCNWLSADYTGIELSVRLREPHLVQEVAGALADLCRAPSGAWGRDVTSLLKIRDRCRRTAPSNRSRLAKAMLVFDEEHYAAVRDVRNVAPTSVNIGCDLFGPAGETSVLVPLQTSEREDRSTVRVLYKRPTEGFEAEVDRTIARFSSEKTTITQVPQLHGKFLSWDDETVIITSFNWLAASLGSGHASGSELGIFIHDHFIVKALHEKLEAVTGIQLMRLPPEGILDDPDDIVVGSEA